MRGKRRTKEERHELFTVLESYLAMGFSLKKACSFADIPYSSMRDMLLMSEPLRAHTRALQNTVNVTARANIITSIEQGNINDSKWWLERFDDIEPQASPIHGGAKEGLLTMLENKEEYKDGFTVENAHEMKELLFG